MMGNVIQFGNKPPFKSGGGSLEYKGLIGLIKYDPFKPRTIESMKLDIMDGRPLVIRLHSAADYPVDDELSYQIDNEGQAMMICGYDDDKQAFAYIDPRSESGPEPEIGWLAYSIFDSAGVNASKGAYCLAVGLDVSAKFVERSPILRVEIGFPQIRGTIMDHDCIYLGDITASIEVSVGSAQFKIEVPMDGKYYVNQRARSSLDLCDFSGQSVHLRIEAGASLFGTRPYNYVDRLGAKYCQAVSVPALESQQMVGSLV